MATRLEQSAELRKRLEQGKQARERVLSGQYNKVTPIAQAPVNPRTAAVQQYIASRPSIQDFPKEITNLGADRIKESTLFKATQGNVAAAKDYQAATGIDVRPVQGPPKPSQHQLNKNAIASKAKDSAFANFVAPFSNLMNDVTYGNKVGQFITRSVGTGAEMLLGTPSQAPATTGNNTADKIADVLGVAGGIAGAGFNPSGGGNLITSPLRGVSGALNTKAGQALTNGVSKTIPKLSQPMARAGIEGAATGAIGGVAAGLIQGQDSNKEIATNALLGGGLGAVGDIAIRGISQGLRNALTRVNEQKAVPEIQEMLALPEGRGTARMNQAQTRSRLNPNDSAIINPTDWTPPTLSLPEANVAAPTSARVALNPYRVKFENLMRVANETKFTPGRESEELEGLWANMADRDDPGLSQLIDLAYPKRKTVTPDMMQRARTNQAQREIYGVPMPVKSLDDRAPSQVIGEAAAPRQMTGLNRTSPNATRINVQSRVPSQANDVIDIGPSNRIDDVTPPRQEPPVSYPDETANTMKQNWFTDLFGNQGVGISAFGSNKRIRKGPLSTEDQIVGNPLRRDAEGLIDQGQAAGRAVYQNYVDFLSPLKQISPKAYSQALDSSRSNNIANTIIRDKFVDIEGNVLGKGLEEITQKVARGQSSKFKDYLVLKDAETRMARGENVYARELNMTKEKVKMRIEDYNKRYPEFKGIAQELYNYQNRLLDVFGVDEGLLTSNLREVFRKSRPNYVPMRRQFSLSEKFSSPSFTNSNSFSGQKAPIKQVSKNGSARNIVDPYRSIVESTGAWVQAAMRNRVMQTLVDAVNMDPKAYKGIVEIVQPMAGQKNLRELLDKGGDQIDILEELSKDFDKLFKRTKLSEDNIVRAMVKGEPVYLKVNDPEAVKALVGLGPETTNSVMKVFQSLSDATKYAATGVLAPMFSVKSVIPDTIQAMINSDNSLAHLKNFGHALVSSIADTLPANTPMAQRARTLAQDFRRSGGEYSAALRGERRLKKSVSSLSREPLLSPQGVSKGVSNVVAAPFKALNKVADVTENLNRMAAFKTELDRAGGERTPEAIRSAINQGREITTNFSRRGAQSQSIEAIAPYSNAATQSLYRVAKQVKNHPLKTLVSATALVLLPKAYEYMMFADDEDYKNLPAREKFRNLFIGKTDEGKFIKVPMPQEYNAMGALATASVDYLFNDNSRAFKGAADAMANAYTPPLVTGLLQGATQKSGPMGSLVGLGNATVMGPGIALVSNIDYAGRPIESKSLEGNSPANRYDERTSNVAKEIGKAINMSPKKIDYVLRQYGGDPARILLPLTSEQGAGNTRDTLLRNFVTDPKFTNTLSEDFYAAKDSVVNAYNDYQDGKAELPKWYSEDLRKKLTSQAKGSISKQLSEIREEKRELSANKSMSAETKAARQRRLQEQMNKIYIDINQSMEEAGVPLK
ncbi:LPD38 domain-containing protein [Paenibacillus sp. Marseille-Q4541]|uniref:LPD38 domain-containing protein n=1 Tax=Paenibacillus sp. Marseille-Q4541 TaxID=2831522 RepID=UPI001BA57FEE|nr:LPD38 domain-containing protein [Paenibacillus sp. Marseille-Q4541]